MLIATLGSLARNAFLSKLHDAAGDGFADAGSLTALAVGRDKRSAGADGRSRGAVVSDLGVTCWETRILVGTARGYLNQLRGF